MDSVHKDKEGIHIATMDTHKELTFIVDSVLVYRSVPQIRPPFATLALVQIAGGAYTQDATFSVAVTSSLLVPHPQLRVEDNAFDDFAVAI